MSGKRIDVCCWGHQKGEPACQMGAQAAHALQATSKEFAALPPVDHGQGGCILSCSQFEKCAGRELSKKWKERYCPLTVTTPEAVQSSGVAYAPVYEPADRTSC